MAYDPNWPRWVQASVMDHFKIAATAQSFVSLLEGVEERTTAFMEAPNRLEIRINGPFIAEVSANFWHFDVDVNILIFSHMGGQLPNAYEGTDMAGFMAEAASQSIPIKKYGTGGQDDQSLIGCLALKSGRKESVKVFHFGEIDSVNRLRQMGVDTSFVMDICP